MWKKHEGSFQGDRNVLCIGQDGSYTDVYFFFKKTIWTDCTLITYVLFYMWIVTTKRRKEDPLLIPYWSD